MTMTDENRDGENVHTSPEEGHPAGDGPRTDREVGGPTPGEEGGEETGGAPGTKPDSAGMDSHE
jgi:hypothetical protein